MSRFILASNLRMKHCLVKMVCRWPIRDIFMTPQPQNTPFHLFIYFSYNLNPTSRNSYLRGVFFFYLDFSVLWLNYQKVISENLEFYFVHNLVIMEPNIYYTFFFIVRSKSVFHVLFFSEWCKNFTQNRVSLGGISPSKQSCWFPYCCLWKCVFSRARNECSLRHVPCFIFLLSSSVASVSGRSEVSLVRISNLITKETVWDDLFYQTWSDSWFLEV